MTPSRVRVLLAFASCLFAVAQCQQQQLVPDASLLTALAQISHGSERFSLDLFKKLSDTAPADFILSPFSVWSLLILTAEGAVGNTRQELYNVLGLPNELSHIRDGYKHIQEAFKVNTSTIQLALTQVLFTDENRPINYEFEDRVQRIYRADHVTVNFSDTPTAYYTINDYVEQKTNGKLGHVVSVQDLKDPQLMLISAIYFKGQWTIPFNRSFTREEDFHDETGRPIGRVNMMYQSGPFAYSNVPAVNSHVLEMSYGVENRLSIIFILPRKGDTLSNVMQLLQNVGLQHIITELKKSKAEFEDDEVEVYLPRFTTRADFVLNTVLSSMGLRDIFNPAVADLSLISSQAFLSRIIHKAQIEVNEEGTEASAATVGGFANKNTPPRFVANRPFAYIIIEKQTNLMLFCGQVKNPV